MSLVFVNLSLVAGDGADSELGFQYVGLDVYRPIPYVAGAPAYKALELLLVVCDCVSCLAFGHGSIRGWWLVGVEVDFLVKGLESIGKSVYLAASSEVLGVMGGQYRVTFLGLGIEALVIQCLLKFCFQVIALSQ